MSTTIEESITIEAIEKNMKKYNDQLKNNINDYISTDDVSFLNDIEDTNKEQFNDLLNNAKSLKKSIENQIKTEYENNKLDVDAVMLMSHSELIEKYSKELNLSVPLRREIYYSSLKEKIRMWMYIIGIVFLIVFIVKYMLKINIGNTSSDSKVSKNPLKIENPFAKKGDTITPNSSVEKEIVSPLKQGEL